jgi:hypothetical protein
MVKNYMAGLTLARTNLAANEAVSPNDLQWGETAPDGFRIAQDRAFFDK